MGGYGLVLTWLRSRGDERMGETMVVFVDTASATGFTGGALGARDLIERADIRLFEGDVEKARIPIPVDEALVAERIPNRFVMMPVAELKLRYGG